MRFWLCVVSSDGQKLTIKLLIKGLINISDQATFAFSHISNSQVNPKMWPVDNWFVIGTTSRSTARKLVKILKYTKKVLAVGTLDQFVMKFLGPRQSQEWLKTFNKICQFLTQS